VGGEPNHEMRLTTTDDAATVAAFYRERFAAAGMQKTSDFLSGRTAMMSRPWQRPKGFDRDHQREARQYGHCHLFW
jgi:hypothetical protein